eukprot:622968-Rhodomonas_salina.1
MLERARTPLPKQPSPLEGRPSCPAALPLVGVGLATDVHVFLHHQHPIPFVEACRERAGVSTRWVVPSARVGKARRGHAERRRPFRM